MTGAIVIEDILMELFKFIPEREYIVDGITYTTLKPTYHYGDTKECNALIVAMKHDMYPLIYQTSSLTTQNSRANAVEAEIVLVLAQLTSATLLNDQRWATTYKNTLMPLVDYIVQTFTKSRTITWDETYTLETAPNYSESPNKDENAFIDIVDAVIFRATIKITGDTCLDKNIIYKKV